jgi:hypothetical protein
MNIRDLGAPAGHGGRMEGERLVKTRTFPKGMMLPFAAQATRSVAQGNTMRAVVPLPAGSDNDFIGPAGRHRARMTTTKARTPKA